MLEQVESNVLRDMFMSIIEDADGNVLLVNEDLRIISINPGFSTIFLENYSIELRPGISVIELMELVNPRLAQEWRERCLHALAGNPFKIEEVFELGGKKFYWEIYYKCLYHNADPIVSVFSRDITMRKSYQKKILESEANLRSILNSIENNIWLVNSNLELIDFNKESFKRHKQIYGIRLQKGKNVLELVPGHLRELWRERYDSGLKGRPGKYQDEEMIDGEIFTFETKTYPIVENGVVTGLTINSRDITVQKKTEDLLTQQNEELTIINGELDRFVYSASHDLRAPLMSIRGLLNMIKVDPEKNNTGKYLELIEKSITKLDSFIADIIHYSRNSRMDLLVKEIDFYGLLEESISSLKYMEGATDVQCSKNILVHAPFHSDHSRLLIIFNNIISNAVRYRDIQKTISYLHIDIHSYEEKAIIRFSDNGIGIAHGYRENIFKMFFRASADSKGSGLGLYIVKSAVEKLLGSISIESTLGEGSSFIIEVPNRKERNAL